MLMVLSYANLIKFLFILKVNTISYTIEVFILLGIASGWWKVKGMRFQEKTSKYENVVSPSNVRDLMVIVRDIGLLL